MNGAAILVVEDDSLTRRTLQELLEHEGFAVVPAATVAEAMAEVGRRPFDLVLLDLILPDGDGLTVCRRIRARHHMPIIILSTKREIEDRVAGLETGADDYMTKPFEPREVIARVRAQLRRALELNREGEASVIRAGNVVIDVALRDAMIDGRRAGLTSKEFELLHLLAQRAGRAVSREFLHEQLWSEELSSEKNVAVYVRRVREKIERDPGAPEVLLTVRGYGYRLAR